MVEGVYKLIYYLIIYVILALSGLLSGLGPRMGRWQDEMIIIMPDRKETILVLDQVVGTSHGHLEAL